MVRVTIGSIMDFGGLRGAAAAQHTKQLAKMQLNATGLPVDFRKEFDVIQCTKARHLNERSQRPVVRRASKMSYATLSGE